jgi:hypothetical protein
MRRIFGPILALAAATVMIVVVPVRGAAPEGTDSGLTAVFVRYYSAIQKGRWKDAFDLLHDRLKEATQVSTPEDLAQRSSRTQQELIAAFQKHDRLEVGKTEVDLTSIKARVTGAGDGDVAGQVSYDLVVFPKGTGRALMYRVVLDVGLSQGRIIRITQESMTRIDPGALGDVL